MKIKIENRDIDASSFMCIGQEKDKTFCSVSPNLTLDLAFQLLHTLSLHILNAYTIAANEGPLAKDPTEEQTNKFIAIKEQLYDYYNTCVSSVLELYAPEFELRPDVTADAIAKVEENIVKERYSHLSPKEKQEAANNIQKFKKEMLKHKAAAQSKNATATQNDNN